MITDVSFSFSNSDPSTLIMSIGFMRCILFRNPNSSSLQRESPAFSSPSTRNVVGPARPPAVLSVFKWWCREDQVNTEVGVYEHSVVDQSDFKDQLAWCPNSLTKRSCHFTSLNLFPPLQMANMMPTCRAILGIKWDNVYFKGNHGRLLFFYWYIPSGLWEMATHTLSFEISSPPPYLHLHLLYCQYHQPYATSTGSSGQQHRPLQSGTLSPIPFLRK